MLNYLILLIALILFLGVYAFFRIRRLLAFTGPTQQAKKQLPPASCLRRGLRSSA